MRSFKVIKPYERRAMAISGSELEDFSASSTVIAFDHPLPLLRGPIPASPSDDPSIGPFVLAFRDDQSWRIAYRATESKIIEQCQVGISDDSDASLFLSFLFFFFPNRQEMLEICLFICLEIHTIMPKRSWGYVNLLTFDVWSGESIWRFVILFYVLRLYFINRSRLSDGFHALTSNAPLNIYRLPEDLFQLTNGNILVFKWATWQPHFGNIYTYIRVSKSWWKISLWEISRCKIILKSFYVSLWASFNATGAITNKKTTTRKMR